LFEGRLEVVEEVKEFEEGGGLWERLRKVGEGAEGFEAC
jgi:hypothetical protein